MKINRGGVSRMIPVRHHAGCRGAHLALGIALLVVLSGAPDRTEEAPTAHTKPSNANHTPDITAAPATAPVAGAQPDRQTKHDTATDQTVDHAPSSGPSVTDWIIAASALASAIFAGVLAWFTRRLILVGRDQHAAAIAAQRPWIKFDAAIKGDLEDYGHGVRLELSVPYRNTGNSPAIDVQAWAALIDRGDGASFVKAVQTVDRRGGLLGPSLFPKERSSLSVWATMLTADIEHAQGKAFASEHLALGVVVSVSYRFAGGQGQTRRTYLIVGPGVMEMVHIRKVPIPASALGLRPTPLNDVAT